MHFHPTRLGHDPPQIFQTYATYKPGVKRIVEINVDGLSVRVKSTPECLRDHAVEYTTNGPKIVNQHQAAAAKAAQAPPRKQIAAARPSTRKSSSEMKQDQPTTQKRKPSDTEFEPPTHKRKQSDTECQPPAKRKSQPSPPHQPLRQAKHATKRNQVAAAKEQEEEEQQPARRRPGRPRKTEAPAFSPATSPLAKRTSRTAAAFTGVGRSTRASSSTVVVKTEPKDEEEESRTSELTDIEDA